MSDAKPPPSVFDSGSYGEIRDRLEEMAEAALKSETERALGAALAQAAGLYSVASAILELLEGVELLAKVVAERDEP